MLQIFQAETTDQIALVRTLMREYQQALGVDLCFQNFAAELDGLPGSYARPRGRLLLAALSESPVGCIALQPIDASRCEMKRLYVRAEARGVGLGRTLVRQVLEDAKAIGYDEIFLDTLPTMHEAQRLYEQFGFVETDAYRANPIAGTRYLRKALTD
jgi:putative acetyltransferase